MIGKTISHYRILDKLGAGGMGEVYMAEDTKLKRRVALKFLSPELTHNVEAKERFVREAQAASALDHPNICTIHEINHDQEGQMYIVMAYYDGETLKQKIESGHLEIDEAFNIAIQIAKGLSKAHEFGIIHRDIKPGNIVITKDAVVKILDFGLAKLKGQTKITKTGTTKGTVAYMSPEQARGDDIDYQTDIWSFGVVLYEILTGQLPFKGEYGQAVIYSILNEEPTAVSELHANIPIELENIVNKTLKKQPSERYQSTDDMLIDLKRLGGEADIHIKIQSDKIIKSKLLKNNLTKAALLVGIVFAVASIVIAALLYVQKPESVYSTESASRVIRRLTFSGTADVPSWSPDGRHVAYCDDRKINIIPSEGGVPRIVETGFIRSIPWSWTSDASAVLANCYNGTTMVIVKVGLYGEQPQILAEDAIFPSMSASGKKLLYTSIKKEELFFIWSVDLSTGEKTKITEARGEGTAAYKPFYSPDERKIAYTRWNGFGHELWVINPDGTNDHKIDTGPIRVQGRYSWANDGKSILIAGQLHGIWSVWKINTSGTNHKRMTVGSEQECHVSVAPDGMRFVFSRQQDLSRIALINSDEEKLYYPIELGVATTHPSFSLDGDALFFQALANEQWQIWKTSLSKKGSPKPIIFAQDVSCFGPAQGLSNEILYIRSAVARETRWGRIEWSQTIWSSSQDGGRQKLIEEAGNRVERIAPTPYRTHNLLYSANTAEGFEGIYILKEGNIPKLVYKANESELISSFDWGTQNDEIFIAHIDTNLNRDLPIVLSSINISTLKRNKLFSLDSLLIDNKIGMKGYISVVSLSPNRSRIALIVSNQGKSKLVIYDIKKHAARKNYEFEESVNSKYMVWSPNGIEIGVELNHSMSDIYISELKDESQVFNK